MRGACTGSLTKAFARGKATDRRCCLQMHAAVKYLTCMLYVLQPHCKPGTVAMGCKATSRFLPPAGLKSMLLEKRVGVLSEALEMKDAQLGEVLAAAHLDPATLQQVRRLRGRRHSANVLRQAAGHISARLQGPAERHQSHSCSACLQLLCV